jgi:hypothetical protein
MDEMSLADERLRSFTSTIALIQKNRSRADRQQPADAGNPAYESFIPQPLRVPNKRISAFI